jgi:hypothetical protein
VQVSDQPDQADQHQEDAGCACCPGPPRGPGRGG